MTNQADVQRNLTYQEWNELLCRHFFSPDRADQPVWFCPDDEVLGDISGLDPEAATASLHFAVMRRLDLKHHNTMFIHFERESLDWKRQGGLGCPPFLALLAVVVLAAVHMAREGRISSTNYCSRLRALLGLQGKGQPHGYEWTIPDLWTLLGWWMDEKNEGKLGLCTVEEDLRQRNKNIGFALSQALIRRADRQSFTHFFVWMDLAPREDVTSEELLARFRVWASGRGGISPGVYVMLEDEHYSQRLAETLKGEAHRWDGLVRDERGRKVSRIYLTLSLAPSVALGLAAERPEGFPETGSFVEAGGLAADLASEVEGWYGFLPQDFLVSALAHGLRLICDDYTLEFGTDFVIPLRQNVDLGCWASVRDVSPGEPHCLLIQETRRAEVLSFLKAFAVEEWSKVSGPGIPTGWFALRNVIMAPVQAYEGPLRRLVPSVKNRATLQGGLPLREHRLYLRGGEPDIWVPSAQDVESLELTVDGEGRQVPTGSLNQTSAPEMEAGYHVIKVGTNELSFRTIETLGRVSPDVDHQLRFDFQRTGDSLCPQSLSPTEKEMHQAPISVCGASVVGDLPSAGDLRPVVLRVGAKERVLLGALPGQVSLVAPVPVPSWTKSAKLYSDHFEVLPTFPVVWVLQRWEGSGWAVRLRESIPPDPTTGDPTAVAQWARFFALGIVLEDVKAAQLWHAYENAARTLV
jgi:hypothetical protein